MKTSEIHRPLVQGSLLGHLMGELEQGGILGTFELTQQKDENGDYLDHFVIKYADGSQITVQVTAQEGDSDDPAAG